jgi:translation elongation factor EF-4
LNQVLGLEKDQTKDMVNTANDLALLRSTNRKAIGETQMKAGTQNMLATLGGGDAEAKKKKLLEQEAAKSAQGGQASQVGTTVLGALG